MTKVQRHLKQIIRLAEEAAPLLTGEDHQAAIEIKLAAECLLAGTQKAEMSRHHQPYSHRD
jgi:hypothetical protein